MKTHLLSPYTITWVRPEDETITKQYTQCGLEAENHEIVEHSPTCTKCARSKIYKGKKERYFNGPV